MSIFVQIPYVLKRIITECRLHWLNYVFRFLSQELMHIPLHVQVKMVLKREGPIKIQT